MKKFIEALKKAGIYDHIVETIVDGRLDRSTSSLEVLMSMTQWNSKHMVSTMT